MNPNRIDDSLQDVKNLISFLRSRNEGKKEKVLCFERAGLGVCQLDYEEYYHYDECLRKLMKASVEGDDSSIRTIEDILQEALLKAFNLNISCTQDDLRIDEIINDLKQKITAKRISYLCCIPVCGMKDKGLPFSLGEVEFVVFDAFIENKYRKNIENHTVQKELKLEAFKEKIDRHFYGNIYALVSVNAKDSDSAQVLSIKKLRGVIDILNFFSDLVPYNPNAFIYLKGDMEPCCLESIILNQEDGGSYSIKINNIGPLQKSEITKILELQENIGFDYIINLLNKNNLNKFEQALITAIQWAGRAVVANRREDSFLLFAIALESIILVDNPGNELSYRLRIRIAHLITNNLKDRHEVMNTVKEHYNLRSKLVHDGKYEITGLEMKSLRHIATACIARLCTDPLFQKMTSPKDFSDWLENQILS